VCANQSILGDTSAKTVSTISSLSSKRSEGQLQKVEQGKEERRSGHSGEQIIYVYGQGQPFSFHDLSLADGGHSALKPRYLLPIRVPTEILTQPGTTTPFASPAKGPNRPTESVIVFDAKLVARKYEGWENMLETLLFHWVRKAVGERRSAR